MDPVLVALAGPKGAGKTTFYEAHLSGLGIPFLNADRLTRQLGIEPYRAAAQIATIRDHFILQQQSFIMETVFSDPVGEKVDVLASAATQGFDVQLLYIGIASRDVSVARVESRTRAGGHSVPTEKLLNRFERSPANLERAIRALPDVVVIDNS